MFTTVEQFLEIWRHESAQTARVLAGLTDESLGVRVTAGYRTIGELAWHITVSQREIAGKTGLAYDAPDRSVTRSRRAAQIHSIYVDAASALAAAVRGQWTDETLALTDDVYGMRWPRGRTLFVMLLHEVHHRGQLTVLMRQAGLKVPGVYGPSRDEQ